MANETPSRPPPFMANAILNFHFDFLTTSPVTQIIPHVSSFSLISKYFSKFKEKDVACVELKDIQDPRVMSQVKLLCKSPNVSNQFLLR